MTPPSAAQRIGEATTEELKVVVEAMRENERVSRHYMPLGECKMADEYALAAAALELVIEGRESGAFLLCMNRAEHFVAGESADLVGRVERAGDLLLALAGPDDAIGKEGSA